jgi:hypothetical protein
MRRGRWVNMQPMAKLTRIHQNKQPIRRHFINEWLAAKGLKPADLVDLLNDPDRSMDLEEIGKSQVYRWLAGQLPQPATQLRVADALEIEPEALLRHPDDDWVARFMEGRSQDEIQRIKNTLENAFPKKDAG